MKATFIEYDGCFGIEFHAETMAEAATLVRFGANRTDELRVCSADVSREGNFTAAIVFKKSKRANSDVPKRK